MTLPETAPTRPDLNALLEAASRTLQSTPRNRAEIARRWTNVGDALDALYAKLAALEASLATSEQRSAEMAGAHSRSFGALAEISSLTALDGEVDEYGDVVKAVEAKLDGLYAEVEGLRASLATAQRDSVWVVEQVEDHAGGWVWGAFSTKELAEQWCIANPHVCPEITECVVDGNLSEAPKETL